MKKFLAVLICPLLLCSCATITTGTHQKIPVSSRPAGANVQVSTGEQGITPCMLDLARNTDHSVTISKDGYEDMVFLLRKGMCGSTAGNLVLGGIIGLGVDACSGAMFKLEPGQIDATLNKK